MDHSSSHVVVGDCRSLAHQKWEALSGELGVQTLECVLGRLRFLGRLQTKAEALIDLGTGAEVVFRKKNLLLKRLH